MGDNGEHIEVAPQDGAGLNLPLEEASHSLEAYLDKKYSPLLREASQVRPDETPDAYLTRVLVLYPDVDQQAYLRGLYAITPAGIYAPYALQGFAKKQPVDPKILEIYPAELNQHIFGKGLGDKSLWRLRMKPTVSAEIIRASNMAAYSLRRHGDRTVKETRQMIEEVVLGKRKLENASLPSELKVGISVLIIKSAEKIGGSEVVAQLVRAEVERLVTISSLQFYTHSTAEVFQDISHFIGKDFDALRLLTDVLVPTHLALDNINIHPDVGQGFVNVFDRTVNNPSLAPQQV
jgi:hypothetical protein